jgi:hypothetical protein
MIAIGSVETTAYHFTRIVAFYGARIVGDPTRPGS